MTLTHLGYRIPFEEIEFKKIKKQLTVKAFVLPDYDFDNKPFPVYRKNENYIYLPKFYGIEKYGVPAASMDGAKERYGNNINVQFQGSLKNTQKNIMDEIKNEVYMKDSCVLCIHPGAGKTVCAIWLITQLKKKTLILVHKEFLLNQWIERIQQFAPQARIGVIQQNKVDIEDKDICIGMIQSIVSRKYPKETFDSFGNLIIDECHRICSKSFSQALFHVNTKYSLGLSATPHRKDGLGKLLNWFLGDIISPDTGSDIYKPIIKIIKATYEEKPIITYNMRGKVNVPSLITKISQDPHRNQQIISEIALALKDKRKILVMTERREQCNQLEYLITTQNISNSVGIYIGGMNNDSLEETNLKDIIISTYAMTAEGYDNKTIDTLIMATPRSSIEQILGRCMRQQNKNNPLIIDFVDNLEGVGGQASKREKYYISKDYIKPKPKTKKYQFLDE